MKHKNSQQDDLGLRLSSFFFRHPRAILAALLIPPLLWLGVFYLGSLLVLIVNSFYTVDDFSGVIIKDPSLQTYGTLFTASNMEVVGRTAAMAICVTAACALIAFPLAYYM